MDTYQTETIRLKKVSIYAMIIVAALSPIFSSITNICISRIFNEPSGEVKTSSSSTPTPTFTPTPTPTPIPTPTPTPTPTPIPTLKQNSIKPVNLHEKGYILYRPNKFYIDKWDSSSYSNSFYIMGLKESCKTGIGLYTSELKEDEEGIAIVILKIPEGYDTLEFSIGADPIWEEFYSKYHGEYRLRIFASECVYDSKWQDYQFTELNVTRNFNSQLLVILLEEKAGKEGTLNIALGNFIILDKK